MILKKFFYFTSLLFILMTAACAHQVVDSSSSSTWNAEEKESARIHLTRLALEQSQSFSNKWEPSQRDCAGFVRFLYREAVTGRANMWTNKEHQTVSFVSARELIAYNFSQVNSGEEDLQTGDLLVFYRPEQKKVEDAWHLMMVLKSPHGFQKGILLTYHNGEVQNGEVRKVWLEDLKTSPFSEWRPRSENPNFYGVYRWKDWQ